MTPAPKRIVIVVPCFNEARRFPMQYWREIITTESEIQWLFVDDGSRDGTFDLIKELCKDSTIHVIKLPKNLGKGNAIRLGLLETLRLNPTAEVIGYIDSDGAFSITDVFRLATMALGHIKSGKVQAIDALISSRAALAGRAINRKPTRHYLGRVIATLLTNKWQGTPYDTQSGYKLFRNSQAFRESVRNEFATRWFFDVELLTRIGITNHGKLNIWEEPLSSWNDIDGSKLSAREMHRISYELVVARRQVLRLLKHTGSSN